MVGDSLIELRGELDVFVSDRRCRSVVKRDTEEWKPADGITDTEEVIVGSDALSPSGQSAKEATDR